MKSCWSCKHCINDYFFTGTMDCKKQDDMTEIEFENYYCDNGGENCLYYEESEEKLRVIDNLSLDKHNNSNIMK